MKIQVQIFAIILFLLTGCNTSQPKLKDASMDSTKKVNSFYSNTDTAQINLGNAEWNKVLPKEVFEIAREKGTERAFSGKFNDHKEVGTYFCAVCGNPLFNSNGKFESTCGWPSFFEPVKKGSIIYSPDNSHGIKRTEVMCGRCKSHLGHVFEDGPPPTGLRYCINSVVLDFEKAKTAEKEYQDSLPAKK